MLLAMLSGCYQSGVVGDHRSWIDASRTKQKPVGSTCRVYLKTRVDMLPAHKRVRGTRYRPLALAALLHTEAEYLKSEVTTTIKGHVSKHFYSWYLATDVLSLGGSPSCLAGDLPLAWPKDTAAIIMNLLQYLATPTPAD